MMRFCIMDEVKVLQIKYANFWELPIATWNINVDRDGGN